MNKLSNEHSWFIQGIDCQSCVKNIVIALENDASIKTASVVFVRKKLKIIFNDGVNFKKGEIKVTKIINRLGYSLAKKASNKKKY